MRILHGDGFKLKERQEAKETVVSNLVICIYLIISQLELHKKHPGDLDQDSLHLLQLAVKLLPMLSPREEKEISQYVFDLMKTSPSDEDSEGANISLIQIATDKRNNFAESLELAPLDDHEDPKLSLLKSIWSNYRFRDTLGSLTLFKLPDSALYFLSHFERITSEDFVPSSEDIVRMRRATTGIQVNIATENSLMAVCVRCCMQISFLEITFLALLIINICHSTICRH